MIGGAVDESILLILLRFLIVFSAVSAAVAAFRLVLLCFFRVHSFFFVEEGLENFTDISALIFAKALCVLMTFFVKSAI